ncbi:HNH endonuclease family protein [uncultured Brevibacterium sp.]|uniref:HNH endonuclease family protein n=1 Tax=uncultured Brevibacterium sp. TaxID=189678 RepID=UPI0025E2B736|nr:HNH endonuclease family protein [uncultured Brevibacterium sp.]
MTSAERLAASMLVRRVYATPRQLRYMELLKQLANGQGLDSHSLELTEIERAETLERLNGDIYLAMRVHMYVLLRLDSVLADDPGASYDHKIISVEHVLPQTIDPDSQWASNFTEEEAATWTHRLGNLLLLNRWKNSSAGNYDFDVKKERYFKSGKGVAVFALTTQVLGEPAWTPSVVERRQEALLEILIQEWQL